MGKKDTAKNNELRSYDALNPHPDRVIDPLFKDDEFFDSCDMVQVKYEMLRAVHKDHRKVNETSPAFGFSRRSFYEVQAAYKESGVAGLASQKRGPKGPHKLSDDIIDFIVAVMAKDPGIKIGELVRLVDQRFSIRVHPRSIDRALARRKKKDGE